MLFVSRSWSYCSRNSCYLRWSRRHLLLLGLLTHSRNESSIAKNLPLIVRRLRRRSLVEQALFHFGQ
jgi:hypothetical protein